MTCQMARDWFSAAVDEALAPEDRAALAAHLASCPDCPREWERFRAAVGYLRALPAEHAPAGFVDRVLAATRPVPWPRRVIRWLFVPLSIKLPVEAAAVVLVGLAALYVWERSPDLREASRRDAPIGGLVASKSPSPPSSLPGGAPTPASPPAPAPGPSVDTTRPAIPPPAPSPPRSLAPRARLDSETERRIADLRARLSQSPAASATSPPAMPPAASGDTGRPASVPPAPVRTAPAAEQAAGAAGGETKAATKEAPAPAASGLMRSLAKTSPLGPSVVAGRLAVPAREAAERALTELVARLGGARLVRRDESRLPGVVTLDVVVPREAYPELTAGLARIGHWTAEREADGLGPEVRVEVVIAE